MSENSRHGSEGLGLGDSESGFAALGIPESADSSNFAAPQPPVFVAPAPLPPAPQAPVPLTRRELRAREKAALEQAAAPTPAPVQQAAPATAATTTPAPATPTPANPAPQAPAQESWSVQTPAATTASVASLPVELAQKAPKKPKSFKAVRPPRGVSRPAAAPRPRSSTPRSRPKSFKRQFVSKLMTFGAMVGAGLMMVSTSLPANAFFPVEAVTGTVAVAAPADTAEVQSVKVEAVGDQLFSRDNYTAVSLKERLFLEYGNRNWSYTNNPNGTIQWPFPIAVPISSGFGPRIAPCGGCSSYHEGVDFTPGAGTLIQAVADGVVSQVGELAWGYGTFVVIDHQINGNAVQSLYAHMQRGSARMVVGEQVKVTDIVGAVGSTGASTGAHLHLEIHVNGAQVNPFDWLKANAN